MAYSDTIRENQHVLLRLPSKNIKVVELQPGSIVSLGKFGSFRTDDIIGDPFGYTYQIGENMALSVVEDPENYKEEEEESLGKEQSMSGHKIDALSEQNLTYDEIEELKKRGTAGLEIIARVTQGHAKFEHKTEYSKDKYLKRKKQKFLQQFTPEAIGPAELIEIYLDKEPTRIMNISIETLSLLVTYGNVMPSGTYLVVDETPGVLAAAVLERIGRNGTIVVLHDSEHPNLNCLKYLDLDEERRAEQIKTINYLDFLKPDETPAFVHKSEEEISTLKSSQRGQYYRQVRREKDRQWVIEHARSVGFDALMVMTDLELASLIPHLLPFVGGSKPVVMYSQFKELLVDTTLALKGDTRVLAPTIMETRVRKYQTLPGRIHPLMTSRGYGGYLLWGTRVIPSEGAQAVGRGYQKRKKAKLDSEAATTPAAEPAQA